MLSWSKERSPIPAKVIATCFALLTFVAAVVVGFAAGNAMFTVVWRATIVMVVCWVVGRIVGGVAQSSIERHIEQYKRTHPIPEELSVDELVARKQSVQTDDTSSTDPVSSVAAGSGA